MGDMGAWVARRLTGHGAEVRSMLAGRSSESHARARDAGVTIVPDDAALVDGANFVLSIVPPAEAAGLAVRLAPHLAATATKPIFVDCNAISSSLMREIARVIQAAGCVVLDAGIFGSAPKDNRPGPRFYLSGNEASRAAILAAHGLAIQILDAPVGAASTLKCCFAALGKGVIALGTASAVAARQAGVDEALRYELATYVPDMVRVLTKFMPEAYTKAPRWVAEMREIGRELSATVGAQAIYDGASDLFSGLAGAMETRGSAGNPIDEMDAFVTALTNPAS
jgi:3-hydroxyisobutyrate dehydrogenase-like beta-hydroxyacid dehydrogenase